MNLEKNCEVVELSQVSPRILDSPFAFAILDFPWQSLRFQKNLPQPCVCSQASRAEKPAELSLRIVIASLALDSEFDGSFFFFSWPLSLSLSECPRSFSPSRFTFRVRTSRFRSPPNHVTSSHGSREKVFTAYAKVTHSSGPCGCSGVTRRTCFLGRTKETNEGKPSLDGMRIDRLATRTGKLSWIRQGIELDFLSLSLSCALMEIFFLTG